MCTTWSLVGDLWIQSQMEDDEACVEDMKTSRVGRGLRASRKGLHRASGLGDRNMHMHQVDTASQAMGSTTVLYHEA